MISTDQASTPQEHDSLFQHAVRPDWGIALLVWERDGKRALQFQDGELRVFKTECSELVPVTEASAETTAPVEKIRADLARVVKRRRAAKRLNTKPISLADQLAYFSAKFPDHFQGLAWAKQYRGVGARPSRKRHRHPALESAAELFVPHRLLADLETGALPAITRIRELLLSTDLVPKSAVVELERVDAGGAHAILAALLGLMAEAADVKTSFDAWVTALSIALRRKPTWELATTIPALALPQRFIPVKRPAFIREAAWLAPQLVVDPVPSGRVYRGLLEMCEVLAVELVEAGLRPRDNFDLYDFIQLTLSPAAVAVLTELEPAEPAGPAEAVRDESSVMVEPSAGAVDDAEEGGVPDRSLASDRDVALSQ